MHVFLEAAEQRQNAREPPGGPGVKWRCSILWVCRCIKHDIDYMHGRLYSEFQLVARSVSNPAKSHSAPGLLGHHGRRLTVELLAAIRTEFDEPHPHVRQADKLEKEYSTRGTLR